MLSKNECLAYKLENELLKLSASLEQKRDRRDWIDHLTVKECNAIYGQNHSMTPALHDSRVFLLSVSTVNYKNIKLIDVISPTL